MPDVYLSIGSNIDRDLHIPSGLKTLKQQFGELILSSVYESEPVGFVGAAFYNLVVKFETTLAVKELANRLRQIELNHGRTLESQKFSARTLDIDLLLYGDVSLTDGALQLPRADIERYAFVLEPLAEIAPDLIHPRIGQSYSQLWQQFAKQNVKQHKVRVNWL